MSAPRATTALLLTDVGGSTRLWRADPAAMDAAMARHDEIVDEVIRAQGGRRPPDQGEGDSRFAAFDAAGRAVEAALALQVALHAEQWPTPEPVRVRIGVHAGDVVRRGENLLGEAVSRCARLRDAAHPGQVVVSSAVEAILGEELPAGASLRDLGEHRLPDLGRPERVYQLCHPLLPARFPPLQSLDSGRHNLPVQLSRFVGRSGDVEAVGRLVDEHRLVTITGFGGIGKTRLALQVAAQTAASGARVVYFIDLSALRDPTLLLDAVAAALDVRPGETADLLPAVARRLEADDDLVLVLDNLEQVVSGAPVLLELLRAVPGLRLLTTSREAMHLRGEREYALEPLQVPDASTAHTALAAYESVELFIDRAREVVAGFEVDNDSAPAVAAICSLLDGLPLAIELAAARVKSLPPRALLARLTQRLDLPGAGARDLPDRHQTLHATIAWSYELLDPAEQSLLRSLSAFAGGAPLEAVEAVCGGECPDVIGLLSSLVDKSLVRQRGSDDGDPRFEMFQTVRAFAAERLAEDPAARDRVTGRHATHFRDAVATLVVGRFTEQPTVDYVHRELDNLRAALDHFRETGRTDDEAQLLADMADAAWHRGHWDELIRRALDLLERTDRPSETTFTLLDCVAVGSLTSNLDRAEVWSKRAIEEAAALGRPVLEARSWVWLAHLYQLRGDLDLAEQAVQRGLALAEETAADEPRYRFYAREVVLCEGTAIRAGLAIRRAQWDDATDAARHAVRRAQALGDADSLIRGHVRYGGAALGAGRLDEARTAFAAAVDLCRGGGVRGYLPLLLSQLADVERRRGDRAAARVALAEAVSVAAELGVREPLVEIVLADCTLDDGDVGAASATAHRLAAQPLAGEAAVRHAVLAARAALALADPVGALRHARDGMARAVADGNLSAVSSLLRAAAAALADDRDRSAHLADLAAAHEHDPGPVFLRGLVDGPTPGGATERVPPEELPFLLGD